jgi:Putative metallopeptidase
MTDRISCRRHLAGAMMVAALIVNAPTATAQPTQQQSQIVSGIDEAIKALDKSPRLKNMSPQAKKQLVEFVIGNTLFVMAHEMGHGLINEMDMPVLGREEDAADSFAIVTALKMGSGFSERVLIEAVKGQVLSSKRDKKLGHPLAFYDEHGLDLQRAYNVVCFMVGSDPEKYKALATDAKLPEERQASCVFEWKNTAWSWDEMLKPHLRSADQPKIAIKIEYEDNKKYALQADVLRHMGLLEALAAHAADRYAWPKPFAIEARTCGEPNARWKTRTLTLCYELANEFIKLFLDYSKTLPRNHRAAG